MKEIRKVQLILPDSSFIEKQMKVKACVVPLSLISIASYIKKKDPSLNVEVLDGYFMGQKEVERRINADLVGISVNLSNYATALKVARLAKKCGAEVLLGGVYANAISRIILEKRKYVDGIILGDGEVPFYEYIQRKNIIHNLVYRKNGTVKTNPLIWPDLEEYFPLDYSFLPISAYMANYRKNITDRNAINLYSHKGCYYKNRSGGCKFCSIPKQKLRSVSAERYWKTILELHAKYDAIRFIDYSDQFITNTSWLKNLVKLKPQKKFEFVIFSRVNDITEQNVKLLKKLGCVSVLLGIESGDQNILTTLRKGTTVKQNLNAAKLLSESNIYISPLLMMGSPGESKESLNKSLIHIKEIIALNNTDFVELHQLTPFPGTELFDLLLEKKGMKQKYAHADVIEDNELCNDFVREFCSVTQEELKQFEKRVNSLALPIMDP